MPILPTDEPEGDYYRECHAYVTKMAAERRAPGGKRL
jgi:hypothetical protein